MSNNGLTRQLPRVLSSLLLFFPHFGYNIFFNLFLVHLIGCINWSTSDFLISALYSLRHFFDVVSNPFL